MKLRRLLAMLLALILTVSPVVNATSGEGTPDATAAEPEYQAIAATDTSLVLWSAAVKYTEGAAFVERGSTNGLYADAPRIDTLMDMADGEFNKSGEEWPWISTKVSVPAAGTYTLGVTTNSCKWADFKIPMVVDGEVYTLTYTAKAQTQTAEVSLSAGDHTVVVFWPMPANESEVYVDADWNSYLWANIAAVEVDSALTVSKPTVAETEAVFAPKAAPADQTIAATDTSLVLWSAAVKYTEGAAFVERGSTNGLYADAPRIDTLMDMADGEFNKSGEEWPWISTKVSVPAEGTYTLGVTTNSCKWADFKIPMVVDGEVYTLTYTAKAQTQTAEVSLSAGDHVVVIFWPMPADESEVYVDADWNSYLWANIAAVEVDSALTVSKPTVAETEAVFAPKAEPEDQSIAANDDSKMLWSNAVSNVNNRLEFAQRDAVKADLPYIDSLKEDAVGEFNKSGEEWGWFAYKITVPTAGTYTLGVETQDCRNAPYYIPLYVDGEVYALEYAAKGNLKATAEVELPAGTHTVVMFMPMPMNEAGSAGQDWVDYPWCNVQSMIVDHALTVSKPTVAEVEACFAPPADTVIPAVDTDYILLSNSMQINGTKLGCINQGNVRYDAPLIETLYVDAYEQFNASGTEWNWFAYKISVPAAGTYTLGVETAGCKNASYTIPMCVNGNAYTLTYTANAQQVTAEVELPAGEHVVVVFSPMPANEAAVTGTANVDYPWCDFSNVVVDYKLTASKPTVAEVEACFAPPADTVIPAVDTDYILLSYSMQINGTKLGCINQGNVRYDAPLIETLYVDAYEQFNASGTEWNWFAYKISVPAAGTYTLGVETAGCKNASYTIPVCVNGNAYTLTYTANAQKVTAEVELPKGDYVVVIFSPMPANEAAVTGTANVDYPWCDFSNVVVDYKLTASKPTVAEVEACFPAPADTVIPAVDTDYILLSNSMQINGTKLGCINQGNIRYDAPLIESLYDDAPGEFNASGTEWNWFAYKISVPAAGTYTLGVETAGCKNASYTIPMCVNGNAYTLAYTANAQKVTAEVELPKGDYVVVLFSPMPANAAAVTGTANVDYPWCDFSNVVVDYKLAASKPTVAEVEACFPAPADTVIPAVDTDYILLSNSMQINGTKLGCINQGNIRYDAPLIESLYADAPGEFNASGTEWNWFAYKISVPAAGTYTLGVETAGCKNASYTIPMCVNGNAYTLTYTANAQKVTAEVELPKGDYVVVIFSPMPANEAAVTGTANVDYPWCDFSNVVVDYQLTASKPTVAEVEACFTSETMESPLWQKSALFVGDSITHASSSWASVIGNAYKMDWTNSGISGATISDISTKIIRHQLMLNAGKNYDYVIMHGAMNDAMSSAPIGSVSDSFNVADFDTETYIGGLETMFYYAYENFPGAKLGYIINYATPNSKFGGNTAGEDTKAYYEEAKKACDKWGIPYIDLYSGKTADGKSYSFDILQVDKVAENFVSNDPREIHLSAAGYKLISPYIAQWMETFTDNVNPIPAANSGKHINANDGEKVLYAGFTPKSENLDWTVYVGLQDRVYTGMAEDGANIEMLPYAKDLLGDWAFGSIAVDAAEDGEYTFKVEMSAKVPYQMGMLVDDKAYTLNYTSSDGNYQYAEQTVSLTKGKHYITFTAAMPNNDNELDGEAWDIYPWTNIASIIVDEGLQVQKAPTLEEVAEKLSAYEPAYTRVEAEDADYVVYNLTNSKGTPQANAKASGGYLIGDTWNSNLNQTYAQVAAWLNSNKQAYLEYAVIAPESGEYEIRVAYQAGSGDTSVAKPYVAVVVNNTAYKAQFSKDWDQIDKVKLTVKLERGLNIIRCTGVTVDQEIYKKGWVNYDFIDLDKRLAPVKHSSAFMEAENAKYYNKFEVQAGDQAEGATGTGSTGKVLGKSDRIYVTGLKMTLDNFSHGQLKQVPYFAVTVIAPMDGYYPVSLKMSIDGRQKNGTIAMLVDGNVRTVKYDKVGKQAKDGEVDTLVYLTAGEHVLTFTIPMPANSGLKANYSYCWCNYDSVTVYNGLRIAQRQKAPTSEPDYTRVEVEEHAQFNLCGDNGKASGNGYYKVSQSVEEIKKDGIDGSRTPYIELTVNAKKAGNYVVYLGNTNGMTAATTRETVYGQFVVEVNGKQQTKTVEITKKGASTITQIYMDLEEGENIVRLTHLTSDAQYGGTTWIDFDYFEMPSWVAGSLEFAERGTRLEAEDANYDAFAELPSGSYSGGAYLGRANYDTVEELDITHDTLDPKDLGGLPHVRYRVFTEKAGTYNLTVGFAAGLTNYPAAEVNQGVKASFTVVVNNETKQRVEFNLRSTSASMARLITVDLQAGENEIIVTGTTSEYVIDRKPRNDETYRLVWIDQDYLDLSAGVTGTSTSEENINIDDSDIDHAQLDPKVKSDDQDGTQIPDTEPAKNGIGWIWVLIGVGSALLLLIILLLGKKRKKKKE